MSVGTSAGVAVRDALAAALRAALPGVAVFVGEAAAGVRPSIAVEEPQATDWSAVGFRGRELRTGATVRVADGQAGRMAELVAGVERAGERLSGDVTGWRLVGAVFLRARPVAAKGGGVAMLVEHRVRVVQL